MSQERTPTDWLKVGAWLAGLLLGIPLVCFIFFRTLFVDTVDNYEQAYMYSLVGDNKGKIRILSEKGWIISRPFVDKVHAVDLRPMQVCINANSRVLNCKLVEFNPKGLETFLEWHGRNDYSAQALNPILMSYAYDGSGKSYPFLNVLRELKPEEVVKQQ